MDRGKRVGSGVRGRRELWGAGMGEGGGMGLSGGDKDGGERGKEGRGEMVGDEKVEKGRERGGNGEVE